MTTKQYLLLPDTTIQKLELNKMTAWEIKYIFKSISNFNQSYTAKDEKKVKTLLKKLNNFDFISTKLFDKTKGTRISFAKDVVDINKSKTYKKPYACYYLDTIEGIKKKKSLLLYVLIQMTAKKSNQISEKQIEVKAKDLAEYVDYQRLSALDDMVNDINSADHRQQLEYTYVKPEKSFVFTIKDIKDNAKEKRSLALDTISNKALADVSDCKLEQMFLEVATEIVERNGGDSSVTAVDMLNNLKNNEKQVPSSYVEAITTIEETDDTDELLEQHTKLTSLVSRIDRRLELKDSQTYALARQRETYNDWKAKKVFSESQKTLDVDYVSDVLGYYDNQSALQLLEDINNMLCNSVDDMDNKLSFGTVKAIMDIDEKHTVEDFEKLEDFNLIQIVSNNETNVAFLVDGGIKHRKVSPIVNVLNKVHQQQDNTVTVVSGQLCF